MYIVKRDGTEQRFDAVKIKNALAAAFGSVGHDAGEDVLDRLTAVVVSKIPSFPVTVEQVQDLAEKPLWKRVISTRSRVSSSTATHVRKRERTATRLLRVSTTPCSSEC